MSLIMETIQTLQATLNEMVTNESNPMDIYAVSTELDAWIVQYYKQQ